MPIDERLSALTRSLIAGVSLGGIAVSQVGCLADNPFTRQGRAERSVAELPDGSERALCASALQSKSVRDVNAILAGFPSSRCIPPLLGAMPASVLVALSPAAVAGLDPSVVSALPPRVSANLPRTGSAPKVVAVRESRERQY